MSFDISQVLNQWPYQPGEIQVRRCKGRDGKEKVQLRVDLGVLQMNVEGRPDGKRPFGHESLLEHYQARLKRSLEPREGKPRDFRLSAEDCAKLHQEAIQYYHRYICLFQLNDFDGVIRDTERNLKLIDFVNEYAQSEDFGSVLQQFRPQLLWMNIRAKGAVALEDKRHADAIELIQRGLESIRAFYRGHTSHETTEQSGEIQFLESWLKEIQAQRPLSEKEKLEHALNEAVGREDYEKAAEVRDALRNLDKSSSKK